jgi:hypothetical protein
VHKERRHKAFALTPVAEVKQWDNSTPTHIREKRLKLTCWKRTRGRPHLDALVADEHPVRRLVQLLAQERDRRILKPGTEG